MDNEIKEFRNLAKHNKRNIMNKSIELDINGNEYTTFIKGVGAKAIKLELYVYYEDILSDHDKKVLEGLLWDKISRVYPDNHSTTIGDKRVFY